MAFVKILANHLFAGSPLKKLDKGSVWDVPDELAKKWVEQGKAKPTNQKEGAVLMAAPSAFVGQQNAIGTDDNPGSLGALQAANQRVAVLNTELAEATKRGDEAVAELAKTRGELEAAHQQHATELAEATKRGDEAVAELVALKKKAK